MRIAICITTHNRPDVFQESYRNWKKHLPKNAELFVVDDGSDIPVPEANFRFNTAQGISVAKNKCFEIMGDADFYFLVDDDVYPLTKNWWKPYVESGVNHLCLGFDSFSNGSKNGHVLLKSENGIDFWKEPCGLMMMFSKECLEKAGGMDTRYKKWGGEHQDLSQRIHNMGLTKHPFMDVKDGIKLFHSFDFHQTTFRSVDANIRRTSFNSNKQLLIREVNSLSFYPFKPLEDVVITTLFNHIVDPQRGEKWNADESILDPLVKSLNGRKLIVLTDSYEGFTDENVHYVYVKTTETNPYWQRWISILGHLKEYRYGKVFIVDCSDVTLARDPFPHLVKNYIYVGEEQQIIRNPWLMNNHTDQVYQKMYSIGFNWRLLNAGLCGGHHDTIQSFVDKLVSHYLTDKVKCLTDMAGFNFTAYLHFKNNIVHGRQVCNTFKSFKDNGHCWFLHK